MIILEWKKTTATWRFELHRRKWRESSQERRNIDFIGIIVIEMPVCPTLDIMFIGHNISGVGLRTDPSQGGCYSNHGNRSDHGDIVVESSLYWWG
jgi:hypothetical protein